MAANRDHLTRIEGQWDELIRHPGQFAGRRVRVTVLSDDRTTPASTPNEIRSWLAEGDILDVSPPNPVQSNAFGDALAEDFRKQGLVL